MLVNKEYILKWIEKSRNEEDYFDKFVYGFFALNALYSEYYLSYSDERKAIKSLLNDNYEMNISAFRQIFDLPEYEYFCNRDAIMNMRTHSVSDLDIANAEKIREKSPKGSTRAMLMILYQIRCNLFHGDKSFVNSNDQEIMKNASELLLRYNEIFSGNI